MKAHQLSTSPGDTAVAAEIAINLPGESIHPQQHYREARPAESPTEGRIRKVESAVTAESAKKLKYLKNPRIKKLITSDNANNDRRSRGSSVSAILMATK